LIAETGNRFLAKRQKMVNELLVPLGIKDKRTLKVMGQTPRHIFLDSALHDRAYEDYAAPLGDGQTASKPSTVALMTQTAELKGDETVLEVGTGSGYQTAVLSQLADRVYTIERINSLSNRARKTFNTLGLNNVVCLVGDGSTGAKSYAPFDVILVTAGAPQIPVPLAKQLKEGGRMIVPVGDGAEQELLLVVRAGDRFTVKKKDGCSFVPLIGKHGWKTKPSRYL